MTDNQTKLEHRAEYFATDEKTRTTARKMPLRIGSRPVVAVRLENRNYNMALR